MNADKPREAIQPRHRNAWTVARVARLGDARMARARKVPQAVLAHLWSCTPLRLASDLGQVAVPCATIQVKPGCEGQVLKEAWTSGKCVVLHTDGSNAQWNRPKLGPKPVGAPHLVCMIETSVPSRPCALQTVEARRERRALPGAVLQVFPTEPLDSEELRKLSTGCSQFRNPWKTREQRAPFPQLQRKSPFLLFKSLTYQTPEPMKSWTNTTT